MKTLLACLAFIIVLPLSAQTITTVEEQPKPIPFDQLGAEAQKQYAGDGISITPTAGGAWLRAIMQRIEGEATAEGLWLSSTAEEDAGLVNRFRVRAVEMGRMGRMGRMSQIAPTGLVQATKDAAVWLRPGLAEEYSVSSDGVRQDFVVAARPAGTGVLAVELEVAGASAQEAAHGVTLTLDATGRALAYHRLRVNDATGRELAARLEVPTTHRLRVVVEDAGAVYPVRIDPTFSDADWVSLNPGIPGADSTVTAMVVDGSGNLIVGGGFTFIGTVEANYLAKWNGSVWSALGTGMNNSVFALAVIGGDLYAGGNFTMAGGTTVISIAKWDGSAWSALGSGMNGIVSTLAVSGSDLYAGGNFTTAGGISASCIAKWNGSAWSALGSGMNGGVDALAVSGSDLYAGGSFTTAGGISASRISKWNGSAWSALGSGINSAVFALAVSGSDLYAGGQFTAAGGISASRIAKWNGSAWSALGTGMDSGAVSALAVSGSDLYAGGSFNTAGGISASRIAKWNGSAWSALGTGMNSNVRALAVSGSDLYAGGSFTTAGGTSASSIAKWNGSSWSALGTGMNSTVRALAVSGSDLYAGGQFAGAGGTSASRIAKWNGSAWSALGTGMDGGNVFALAVSGSDLYAGGSFTTAGGVTANRIAKWNGSAWSALGSGMDDTVRALAVSGSDLYAGGSFTTAGGTSANRIAKWNGSTWSALGSGMNDSVLALAVSGSDLYAGGAFITAGGTSASGIAKWNGSAWSALGSGISSNVFALAVSGGDLYAGGSFNTAGGMSANRIAKWNGSAWSALGTGMNSTVNALAVSGSDLYAGGQFTTAGGTPASSIAKWSDSAWSALGTGMNSNVLALAADSAEQLYLGGDFFYAGTTLSPYIAQANLAVQAPTVTLLTPASGSTAGGTSVTITGANFTGATGVTFGGTAATSVNVVNDTTITAVTPAHAAGAVSVLVTTPGGTNAANSLYTYAEPPTFTAVLPNNGGTAGGTSVTIIGTNFSGATGVTFGGVAATSVNVVSATQITATTPAGAAGSTSVIVITPGGSNAANMAFTYVLPPTVTLSTANLPIPVTSLTITGTDFSPLVGQNTVAFTPSGTGTVTAATSTSLTVGDIRGLTPGALYAVVTTNSQNSGAPVQVGTVTVPADSFLVTNTADSGAGSLRHAILSANSLAGAETLTFSDGTAGTVDFTDTTPEVITLSSQLTISSDVTITGPGSALLTVSGGNTVRVFLLGATFNANLTGLTISDGSAVGGGGIRAGSGSSLTLRRCVVSNNTSNLTGGGILFDNGGSGVLTMDQCSIIGNTTTGGTGGAGIESGALSNLISNSTFSGNVSDSSGGAFRSSGSGVAATMTNCTFFGNGAATTGGGAIRFLAGVGNRLNLTNCTVTGNRADAGLGGGINLASGVQLKLVNSIVAGNTLASVASDMSVSTFLPGSEHNLIGVDTTLSGISNGTNGNIIGTSASPIDPRLSPLASNGGPTQTCALLAGSPAINAGNSAALPADTLDADGDSNTTEVIPFDQRGVGFTRDIDTVDIGAFEQQRAVSIADLAAANEGNSGTTNFVFTLTRTSVVGDVTMTYTVSGAAVDAADFGGTLPTGTVTITHGNATTTLSIPVSGDLVPEADEDFIVTLSAPDNGFAVTGAPASSTILNDDFPPTLASVTPATGSTAGGTNVTITGTHFTGATAVTFGGTNATSFTVDSATQITATTPAHAAGAVSVLVTTLGGTNAANTAFTYLASSNADLAALILSRGALTPGFSSGTTAYTASVPHVVDSVTVRPFAADAGATLTVNGTPLASGTVSSSLPLSVGSNVITTLVTAEDSATTRSYEITVTRAAAPVGGGQGPAFEEFIDPNPSPDNQFGHSVVALSTGNVVITAPYDDAGGTDAGAAYLFNGATGALISTVTGSMANDNVGLDGVVALATGNYLIRSKDWGNAGVDEAGLGAVTFGNGVTGVSGVVSAANSLVGTTTRDRVGAGVNGVTALTNGNYVVCSLFWDNGSINSAGAATFGNGTTGIVGPVTTANSLHGTGPIDGVGEGGAIALSNGNYVVVSYYWGGGPVLGVGAVTLVNGLTGMTGPVTAANSLIGSTPGDRVGRRAVLSTDQGVTPLSNGNFVVSSGAWQHEGTVNAGAVTFVNGTTGLTGPVTSANSLHGTSTDDSVNRTVIALTNGSYVVNSSNWDNGGISNVGAVTFGNGSTGVSGPISTANSLHGSTAGDLVGSQGVVSLSNDNYVVASSSWDNGILDYAGAATWGSGTTGITGPVTTANSLHGTTSHDEVGQTITPLSNGNYVVHSTRWNNGVINARIGATTWGDGATGLTGPVTTVNSLHGSTTGDFQSIVVTALTNGNYVVSLTSWDNAGIANAGAAVFGNGSTGIVGPVTTANSLHGTAAGEFSPNVIPLTNGNYVVRSVSTNVDSVIDAGTVTFGNGATGITGAVTPANSLHGRSNFDYFGQSASFPGIKALSNGNYVIPSRFYSDAGLNAAGAFTFGNGTTGSFGPATASNSLFGKQANTGNGLREVVEDTVHKHFFARFLFEDNGKVRVGSTETGFAPPATPEITISGSGLEITSGDTSPSSADGTDFGSTAISGGTVARFFTVTNSGTAPLNLTGSPVVQISGAHASDFTVIATPGTPIAPLGFSTFEIEFDPSDTGTRTALVTVESDDPLLPSYTFAIQGTGVLPTTTVSSLDLALSSPRNTATVSWQLVFAHSVTGVNAANFALANTGLTAPGGISVTNPNAPNPSTTWTVTANTGTGDGTLGINFVNDSGLSHEVTNVTFTGQVYDIDKTPPTFTSLTRLTPPAQVTSADSLVFRATFGETVLGVDSTDFSLHGTTTATVTHVALVSGSQYDITVSGGDLASFNGSVGLNLAAGQNITDQAGNALPTTEPATDQTYTVDNTGPTVTISSITGDPALNAVIPVTVQFSESVTGFDLTDITVAGGSKGSFAAVDGDTYTFDLTPSGPGVTVTADIAANGAQDDAGNNNLAAAQFSRTIVDQVSIVATNTVAVEGGAFNALYTFTRGGSVGALTVNFEVDASSTASASDYTLSGGGVTLVGTSGTVTFPDGQTTVQVTLSAPAEAPVGGGQVAESFETIRLNVIAVSGSYVAGSPSTAQVSISQNGTVVVNTNDSGFGSLRQAVANANSLPNTDQPILFAGPVFTDAVPDTIVLQSYIILNSGGIIILGPGAKMLTLANGAAVGPNSWVMRVTSNPIRIHDLTIANGNATTGGGGVDIGTSGDTAFVRCRFLNNRGLTGGAVGTTNATITGGTLSFTDCEFSGNTATGTAGAAGAVFGARLATNIFNCTFSGNSVEGGDGNGGAVRLSRHNNLTVVGNTFTGNSAAGAASASGVMLVPPGGVATGMTFENNIVADNVGNATQPDVMGVFGTPSVVRNNLIGNVGALTDFAGNGNLTGTGDAPLDPLLGPLADNGGSTRTHSLLAGSPALNAGSTPPSFSEVQLLLPGDLVGGTYTLTFGGQTPPPLAFDASGSAVRSALGALSSVGGIGNVSVSKNDLLYFIEFRGALANADQPLITATGAGGLTPTVQTLIPGGPLAHDQRGSGFTRAIGTVDIGAFELQAVSALSPEIAVHDGSHSLAPELTDGQVTPVDFGSTAPDIASTRSFTVTNSGDADLLISSITVPAGYTTNDAAATLAPASTYSFQVSLLSPTTATFAGNVIINSDDSDEAAFDFPITGTVVAPGSDPIVSVGENIAVQGTTGSAVLGGPPGSTLYQFIGSPAINSTGVVASAVQIRHADASLHTGMMVGQPLVLIAADTQTAPSLPGVNHYNFGPPVINETGHIVFTGEVRGTGITPNVNSRCLFSNASDGTLKLVARTGTNVGLTSNLKTIGNFSIGGDLVIFLGTLVDNSIVLFGWDANTGIRPLMRNGQSLDANGVTKMVKSFSILETGNASSGHGKEISVAPTGESVVTFGVAFTDGTSGVVLGSFDGTSDTGFGATYGASQQLADTYAAPAVIPLAMWSSFRSPGFDNTGSYYGFISQMATNTLAGVTSTNNVGVFVDTAPGNLTLQLRENDVATGTSGLVFSDFSDLVLGGGDYEFLVKGEVRGSGVVVNVNDKGLWAQHATNGLVLVAREGSEAPGVVGSTFFRLTQLALPGAAQPMFQASMKTGVGGVTTANDTGLWVINEGGEVKLAVREGDVLDVGGTDRTVTAITALLNGTTTGGALGRRVFLEDGQLTLLLTFSGGVQANAKVVVP